MQRQLPSSPAEGEEESLFTLALALRATASFTLLSLHTEDHDRGYAPSHQGLHFYFSPISTVDSISPGRTH